MNMIQSKVKHEGVCLCVSAKQAATDVQWDKPEQTIEELAASKAVLFSKVNLHKTESTQ